MSAPSHASPIAAENACAALAMMRDRMCWLDTSAQLAAAMQNLLLAGRAFFSESLQVKEPFAPSKKTMTGWRKVGIEYSVSPDRPDLNETFCYRYRDDRADVLPSALAAHPLMDACRVAQELLDIQAAEVFAVLAVELGITNREIVRTRSESWLQLNWSTPATVARDFIQDAHEDGHLITILCADAEGLEVLPNAAAGKSAEWLPILPTPERVVCFPGECGALLTGDAILPTLHQVRAHRHVPSRLSVAYFVNPDLDQQLMPWVPTARNATVDLLRWGQENPARFGLPTL